MEQILKLTIGSLTCTALIALAACVSSMVPAMVPAQPRDSDAGVTAVVQASLSASETVKARQVGVVTREGVAYLSGVVDTEENRLEAGRIAYRTEHVKGVVNDLTVGERTVGSWTDDVLIGSKVRSKLLASSEIRAGDMDVSSSQAVVTLIGRVSTEGIRTDAERIARATRGVRDVKNELLVGVIR